MHRFIRIASLLLFLIGLTSIAQQSQNAEEKKSASGMTPAARLAAAKTAFLKKVAGGNTPFEVISSTLEGWGKYTLVDAPEKADIIIEISSTEDSPASVSSSVGLSQQTGQYEQSSKTTKEFTTAQIKLTALDEKTKVPLWTATEHPKHAMKKVDKENNEVEAAQRLVSKFHDFVEPPQK